MDYEKLSKDRLGESSATIRQRAGLFGVMAVMGLVLAIILPFMSAGLL